MASQTTPHERTTLRTRPYWGKPMVNKPWISPAISGGGRTGHENISNKKKAAPRKTVVAVNFHQLKTSKHQHFPVAFKKNGVRIPAPISTAKKKNHAPVATSGSSAVTGAFTTPKGLPSRDELLSYLLLCQTSKDFSRPRCFCVTTELVG